MPYGPRLRLSRKLLLQAMTPQTLRKYAFVQEREVYRLLRDLVDSPRNFYTHLRRSTSLHWRWKILTPFSGPQVE